MNIVIVGAGKVGYALAKYLSIEGDNVTIIDNNIAALERINNSLDVMCVKGNCTSLKVLNEAGVKDADLLISVTNSDELNMLCSLAAKKLGTKYTISRVRNPEYDEDTLATEYFRDVNKGLNPHVPYNYFPDDDPTKEPIVNWRSAGQLLYSNWLNYYVYQTTPYDVMDI